MATNPAESAFPETQKQPQFNSHTYGLTKREYFAAIAMQGLLAGESADYSYVGNKEQSVFQQCATDAIKYTDALIEELNKGV